MAEKHTRKGKDSTSSRDEGKAGETTPKDQFSNAWIRDDGAICFGDECAVLKIADNGKLALTVKPTRCGE